MWPIKNFGASIISLEWLNLQSLNFCTQVGYINSSKKGVVMVTWLFEILPFAVMQCVARVCQQQLSYLLRYSEKIAGCNLAHLFWRARWGDRVWISKTYWASENCRVAGVSYGVVWMILGLVVLVELRLVTDELTMDRQMDIRLQHILR